MKATREKKSFPNFYEDVRTIHSPMPMLRSLSVSLNLARAPGHVATPSQPAGTHSGSWRISCTADFVGDARSPSRSASWLALWRVALGMRLRFYPRGRLPLTEHVADLFRVSPSGDGRVAADPIPCTSRKPAVPTFQGGGGSARPTHRINGDCRRHIMRSTSSTSGKVPWIKLLSPRRILPSLCPSRSQC